VAIAVKQDGTTISSFVAGVSGLKLKGASVEIDGSTTFSSGLNPADKLAKVGGSYESAASGARVRIFPTGTDYGIQVTDDNAADVFRVYVSGEGDPGVGDVIIGSTSGQYMKWDKSAGALSVVGGLTTGSGGQRVVIDPSANKLSVYAASAEAFILTSEDLGGGNFRVLAENNWFNDAAYIEYYSKWYGHLFQLSSKDASGAEATAVYISSSGGFGGSITLYGISSGTATERFSAAANVNTTGVYKVNGTQVMGAQGNPVADATGAGDVVAQLNTLLARCRAHGWIATT
jgi:hypothetical protein